MAILAVLAWVAIVVLGLASCVFWIMTLIKIFKENTGLGILGLLCGLFAFIYGWVKTKEYNNKKIMLLWTGTFVLSLLAGIVLMVSVAGATGDIQDQIQQMQKEIKAKQLEQ